VGLDCTEAQKPVYIQYSSKKQVAEKGVDGAVKIAMLNATTISRLRLLISMDQAFEGVQSLSTIPTDKQNKDEVPLWKHIEYNAENALAVSQTFQKDRQRNAYLYTKSNCWSP